MDSDNWPKIKEILSEVLEKEPKERHDYLSTLDLPEELLIEVMSLLDVEDEADALMNLGAAELGHDFFETGDQLAGQKVGNYRLLRELGYGGMGSVYLARRDDGKFEQTVALKLLKREMNTSDLRRYFEQEREILASLDHPNIARLLDAGTTDDQIPFIAMEYVDGVPIDDFCVNNQKDLRERLDLFRTVCSAVEFAHRNLVVHRDLKPSNILVTADGIPKLLDFGISKMLSKEYDGAAATITRMGVMTPTYASPEQLSRNSVTTVSDVYSLGVILYELLSGHKPFDGDGADIRKIYAAVLEKEPTRPSSMAEQKSREFSRLVSATTVVQTDPSNTDSVNSTKQGHGKTTRANKLSISPASLRGDLDNIILKALRKEPDRRYTSVAAFSDDITRYLNGLTVSARPNTFGYRASKFISRNKLQVGSAALLLCALGGGVGATLWQARIAQVERVRAEQRFNDVRTLANSFLYEFGPLIEKIPGTTEAQELLVRRALEYLDSLSNEAGDDRELKRELAKAYEKVGNIQGHPFTVNIGDIAGALQSYEKSRLILDGLANETPDDTELMSERATINRLIGELYLNGLDQSAKAVEFYDRAYEFSEKVVAVDPDNIEARARLAGIIKSKGLIPFYNGDNKTAISFYGRSKEIFGELTRQNPLRTEFEHEYAYLYVLIGEAYGWDGDFEASGTNIQKGTDLLYELEKKMPTDIKLQRSLMLANNKLGENYEDRKLPAKAVEVYSKSVAIAEALLANDSKNSLGKRDVAMCYKKKAQALAGAGRGKESLETLEQSLVIFEELRISDPNNIDATYDVANLNFSIGETYIELKDYDKAIKALDSALNGFEKVLSINSANTYAQRMRAYSFDRQGRSYHSLYLKGKDGKSLGHAIVHFKTALESLEKMKTDGNLGEVDVPYIDELKERIADLEKLAA